MWHFIQVVGTLRGAWAKERAALSSIPQERPPCGEMNVIRVAPWLASIWQWRRGGERTQAGSDPATCAKRQDIWFCSLSQWCPAASHTQLLWSFVPTRKMSLVFLESRWQIGTRGAQTSQTKMEGYTVQLSSAVSNVICTCNLHLG